MTRQSIRGAWKQLSYKDKVGLIHDLIEELTYYAVENAFLVSTRGADAGQPKESRTHQHFDGPPRKGKSR